MSGDECRAIAIDALRDIPGSMALYEFGSYAAGTDDLWSDLDMQVTTNDVDLSIAGRRNPLSRIAPVLLEWEIIRSPSAWAATVLFSGMSPLMHLDIGFSLPEATEKDVLLDVSRHHWTQQPSRQSSEASGSWYAPDTGTVEHTVIGDLLSLLLYVKARRRGENLRCWKFFSALGNRVLEATYRCAVDRNRPFGKTLSSLEHMRLQKTLAIQDTNRLATMLLAGDGPGMDRSIIKLGEEIVRLGSQLEHTSASYREHTAALLAWVDHALHDQEFNDAL